MSQVFAEDVKTLAAAGISGAYATVGAATTSNVRIILISNATQGDMMITWDNSRDMIPIMAGSFALLDFSANMFPDREDFYVLPVGTQFYCKQLTAPVDKALYISCFY